MKRVVLFAILIGTTFISSTYATAQVADTTQQRRSTAREVTGGIVGSLTGMLVGGAIGLQIESTSGCSGDICGGGAVAGGVIGSTIGAASGAFLAGKQGGHDVSFVRALGGATLGLVIFGGLTAVVARADLELTLPIAFTIPVGQGVFAGGATRRRPRSD